MKTSWKLNEHSYKDGDGKGLYRFCAAIVISDSWNNIITAPAADFIIIRPKRNLIFYYQYSFEYHGLPDIPKVLQLSANRLKQILKGNRFITVIFDEYNGKASRIIESVPFLIGPWATSIALNAIIDPSKRDKADQLLRAYSSKTASDNVTVLCNIVIVLIDCCTTKTPPCVDYADVRTIFSFGSTFRVGIGDSAARIESVKKAIDELGAIEKATAAISVFITEQAENTFETLTVCGNYVESEFPEDVCHVIVLQHHKIPETYRSFVLSVEGD